MRSRLVCEVEWIDCKLHRAKDGRGLRVGISFAAKRKMKRFWYGQQRQWAAAADGAAALSVGFFADRLPRLCFLA